MSNGLFITLEGGEGAGKSTARDVIVEHFEQRGYEVIQTREPGGTPLAERIRELLLAPSAEPMAVTTELMLMFAARAQHVEQVVKPSLAAGKIVVCDRFVDSSYAYQAGGRGIPVETIAAYEQLSLNGLKPDLTFLLDVPSEVGMARVVSSRAKLDRFELEQHAFFARVRAMFLTRAKEDPVRCRIIDATQAMDVVHSEIRRLLGQITVPNATQAGLRKPQAGVL